MREESPSSTGRDAGEIPGGGTLRKVPQKLHRRRAKQFGAGKGEMARQELTAVMVTSFAGKPHPEQGQTRRIVPGFNLQVGR